MEFTQATPLTCAACLRVTFGPQKRGDAIQCPQEGCFAYLKTGFLGRLIARFRGK